MAKQVARRFYVYQFEDEQGIAYIGKGTGRRFRNQQIRFSGLVGKIVRWFSSEKAAYDHEAKLIASHVPRLNKCAGGGGAITRRKERAPRRTKEMMMIEEIGSRAYVARFLLTRINETNMAAFGLSKVDLNRWREVANGCRA